MLLISINNLKKYFSDRLILNIEDLKVYSEDKFGVVGLNGAGKTTLLNLISGKIKPDEGMIEVSGELSFVTQIDEKELIMGNNIIESEFDIAGARDSYFSGGEKTRLKIAKALGENPDIILLDEPTSNLDFEGISILKKKLKAFKGGMMLVSHDRDFLDAVCNKIIEVNDGEIKIYNGNYSYFKAQKEEEIKHQEMEYEKYVLEKKKLTAAIIETKEKSRGVRKAPRRMGNSEARLNKMGDQKAKASLDRRVKAMEERLKRLELKEKPLDVESAKFDIKNSSDLYSKIIISGENVCKKFGDRIILDNANFKIKNFSRTALIGKNGAGKTTLINMILDGDRSIKVASGVKVGYFSQDTNILDENKSLLENLKEVSTQNEGYIRLILGRLLFKGDDVYKNVGLLSGGERVRASFAKIIVSSFNMLILDEPTNYLDVYSLEAIEKCLLDYKGTLLFVSHDRRFVDKIADSIMLIDNKRIIEFEGTMEEFDRKRKGNRNNNEIKEQILLLENRLSLLIGKISNPSRGDDFKSLDDEYKDTIKKIKELKSKLAEK